MATSHELARELRKTAEFLELHESVEMNNDPKVRISFYGKKEKFLAAVRALKPGRKSTDIRMDGYVNFYPTGTILELYINRDVLCRKVKEAEYECLPLLSPEEDAEMEQAEVSA